MKNQKTPNRIKPARLVAFEDTLEELRRCVRRTATESAELASDSKLIAEAEVGQLYVLIAIHQQVLRLQIHTSAKMLEAETNVFIACQVDINFSILGWVTVCLSEEGQINHIQSK